MRDDFESDAHDYLLHQMEAARRAAFEAELRDSAAARAALKQAADALAGFACATTDPEPLSGTDHALMLEALRDTAGEAAPSAASPAWWRRALWPIAAGILLALNLIDFERPVAPGGGGSRGGPTPPAPLATDQSGTSPAAKSAGGGSEAAGGAPSAEKNTPPGRAGGTAPATAALAQQVADLRENLAELQRANERLRADYDLLVRRHAEQSAFDREINRLSTMELVDPASFARGERKGLVAVARSILAEPGVVISSEPAVPPPLAGSTGIAQPRPAYAWSVFDEQEHRGFLNLYQLPALPVEQSLHLWVRAPDTRDFLRVSEVPSSYYGGNGSVSYALPATMRPPAELLITIEPRNSAPTVPSGPTVLRGP